MANSERDLNQRTNPNPAATEAALLRSRLTGLFADRASLVAYTTHAAMDSGMESEQVTAGREALRHNRAILIHQLDSAQGRRDPKAGTEEIGRFKDAWDERNQALLEYIEGTVTADSAMQSTAETHIHGLGEELAMLLEDMTDNVVSKPDAHGLLAGHLELTTTAIESIAAGDADAPRDVADMARASKEIAKRLARGFAVGTYGVSGNAIAPGANLRADLTSLFVEHVSESILLAEIVAADGAGSEAAKTGTDVLHTNVEHLALRFEEVYGPSTADEFTGIAEDHLQTLTSDIEASASGASRPPSGPAYAKKLAGLFHDMTGGRVSEEKMRTALLEQSAALADAIDAVVEGSPSAPRKIQLAETLAEEPAGLLAVGIVEQFPEEYKV